MRGAKRSFGLVLSAALALSVPRSGLEGAQFIRGDTDASGSVDIADPIVLLLHLYLGDGRAEGCLDAADADDSGALDMTDAVYSLSYLFLGGPQPPAPFGKCGLDPTDDDGLDCRSAPRCERPDVVRSDLARDLSPELEPGDLEELVAGNTAFALDLYRRVRRGSENLFFSPLSVSVALAMAYAGAEGETESEMRDALHFTLPEERLHRAFNYLDLELSRRGQGAAGHAGGGFQLRVVNATWGQVDYSFLGGYLDVLAANYGSGLRLLDFLGDSEGSRGTINEWVAAETAGRIQNLLPQGSIVPETRLVLTNAVYFSAAWAEPFAKELTRDGEFRRLDGSTVVVPFMSHRWGFPYARGDGYLAVELPYDGGELSMVLVAPDEGRFAEFEDALSSEKLGEVVASLRRADVQVTLPKFGCESQFDLVEPLSDLGMPQAFQPYVANFSGIDGTRDLYVSGVLHKSFLAVDEAGTEAAAATAVIIGIVSVPEPATFDRPFIYLIRDIPTGAVIFLGRMLDPSAR